MESKFHRTRLLLPVLMIFINVAVRAVQADCQANEVLVECGGCEGTCETPEPSLLCWQNCKPRRCECAREKGFVRARDGTCILLLECFNYDIRYAMPGHVPKIPKSSLLGSLLDNIRQKILDKHMGKESYKKEFYKGGKLDHTLLQQNAVKQTESSTDGIFQNEETTPLIMTEPEEVENATIETDKKPTPSTATEKAGILPEKQLVSIKFSWNETNNFRSPNLQDNPVPRVKLLKELDVLFETHCLPHCCTPPCGLCRPPCGMNCDPPCGSQESAEKFTTTITESTK